MHQTLQNIAFHDKILFRINAILRA